MENQSTTNQQNPQQLNSIPAEQNPASKPNTIFLLPVLITFLVSAVVFGFGGYYFGSTYKSLDLESQQSSSHDSTPLISPSPSATTSTPEINETTMQPEFGNTAMRDATRAISNDGEYQVFLDGPFLDTAQMWVSKISGQQKKLLVAGTVRAQNAELEIGDYFLISPIWSPDGNQIAYFRAVIDDVGKFDVTDRLDLYVINKDGSNDRLVAENIQTPRSSYGKTDLQWTQGGISYTDSVKSEKVTVQLD